MKSNNKCPKCGSTEIIANAKAIDHGHYNSEGELTVATFGDPDALIFREQQTSALSAWVCVECGYVEFYADSPASLRIRRAL